MAAELGGAFSLASPPAAPFVSYGPRLFAPQFAGEESSSGASGDAASTPGSPVTALDTRLPRLLGKLRQLRPARQATLPFPRPPMTPGLCYSDPSSRVDILFDLLPQPISIYWSLSCLPLLSPLYEVCGPGELLCSGIYLLHFVRQCWVVVWGAV